MWWDLPFIWEGDYAFIYSFGLLNNHYLVRDTFICNLRVLNNLYVVKSTNYLKHSNVAPNWYTAFEIIKFFQTTYTLHHLNVNINIDILWTSVSMNLNILINYKLWCLRFKWCEPPINARLLICELLNLQFFWSSQKAACEGLSLTL
jgi:hypothetical protein